MAPAARRRNHRVPRHEKPTPARVGLGAWLAPPIGAAVIIALAFGAARAQATPEIFVAAGLAFSLVEGLILALVGFAWRHRGPFAAMLAPALTAALAAPARWQVASSAGAPTLQPTDLVADLLLSIAWGALAGLAGATILRARFEALTRINR